ncbi:PilW family protein [Paraherbaspirillum soli]|uniref:PilW family protein n=1 Tax=Paraherbaspirillum soli TaxID=631222 RepID=A0ABW0M941_9BURK
MKYRQPPARGVSLVELMVAMTIGLILVAAVIGVYLAQTRTYKTTNSQASIQNAENAISALLTPTIRAAGFSGCATLVQALSNLNPGGPAPLGTLGANPSMLMGYDAGTTLTISKDNAANDSNAGDWSPSLDASLAGNVEAGSDVLVVLGTIPGSQPVGVVTIGSGSNSLVVQNATGSGISVGQFGAVSDCLKTSVFQITAVAGNTLTHAAGSGALANTSDFLAVNYPIGSQFVPLQQIAFFVAQGQGGQSALMRATLNGATWTIQPLVPGVETMQVLYGIGSNGALTQYVTANAVVNWAQVYAVRLGFLIEGQAGSGSASSTNPTQFTVLGSSVTAPADNRLRHVYEMIINLRNSTS